MPSKTFWTALLLGFATGLYIPKSRSVVSGDLFQKSRIANIRSHQNAEESADQPSFIKRLKKKLDNDFLNVAMPAFVG